MEILKQCPTCNKKCGMVDDNGIANCNLCKHENKSFAGKECRDCVKNIRCNFVPKRSDR